MPRINPVLHLAVTIIALIPVVLSFDAYTPLCFVAFGLVQLLLLGREPVRTLFRVLGPLLVIPAGLFVMNLFFSAPVAHDEIYRFSILRIRAYSLHRAIVLSLRSLALIVLSVGYFFSTRPQELVNSLMQQLGLSPRVGYALYVAWNTIPLLRENFRQIESTHKIRLRGRPRTLRDFLPTAVTLLTGAIRHAERASISMAARGIESDSPRSYLCESRFRARDVVYVAISVTVIGIIWYLLVAKGLFVFGLD